MASGHTSVSMEVTEQDLSAQDSKASGLNKDDSDIDAVMAEIEAGLYGLQVYHILPLTYMFIEVLF